MERNWCGMKYKFSGKTDPFTGEMYQLDKAVMWEDLPLSPDR